MAAGLYFNTLTAVENFKRSLVVDFYLLSILP